MEKQISVRFPFRFLLRDLAALREIFCFLLCVSLCSLCLCVESGIPPLTPAEFDARLKLVGDDPVELLALLPFADDGKAKDLRAVVQKKFVKQGKKLPPGERYLFAQKVAKLLPATVPTPEAVAEVLGKPAKVSRQLLHRRYLEQWRYEQPLPLVLTFDHPKGKSTQLISARAWKVTQP